MYQPQLHSQWLQGNNFMLEFMICKKMEDKGFKTLFKIVDPQYEIPSHEYLYQYSNDSTVVVRMLQHDSTQSSKLSDS